VKGQKLYTGRGRKIEDLAKTRGETIFLTKNKDVAEYYGGTMDNVSEGFVDTSRFIDLSSQAKKTKYVSENFTVNDIERLFPDTEFRNGIESVTGKSKEQFLRDHLTNLQNEAFYGGEKQKMLLDRLKRDGYEGVVLEDATMGIPGDRNSYIVLDKKALRTKSQLTDIWNKANKPTPRFSSAKTIPVSQVSKELPQASQEAALTAEQKIIQALKEAKPVRAEQEALYTAERKARVAKIEEVGSSVGGEAGYYAKLGQLKGELPKAQFSSIKDKVTQTEIDELFNKVEVSEKLRPLEKIAAQKGLIKLVGAHGGTVPTKGEIELLSNVFSPEMVKAIQDNRPLMTRLWSGTEQALNLPRALMATADLSAPLRQGIFLIGRPKQFVPAFGEMFKYALSEKAYKGLIDDIVKRPTYGLMRDSNLALTDIGADITKREEAFMSNLVEKIPIFGKIARGSNRAYSGFLNKLRADVFDDMVSKATNLGIIEQRPQVVDDIATFVNSATGRGKLFKSLEKAAPVLNATLFSPRLMASRLNLLNPVYYAKLDPFVRKEALKSLFSFAGLAGTVLGLAKMGGAEVGTDPRSADFAKIKSGDTRYDILGGFQQYLVLASRLASNQMVSSTTGKEFNLGEGYKPTTRLDVLQRFFESKESPIASFIVNTFRGTDINGNKTDIPTEVVERMIPILAQDMYELYRDNGAKGLLTGAPSIFGIGGLTYTDQIPLESKTAQGKPTIKWENKPGLAGDIVNKIRGIEKKPVAVKSTYDEVQSLIKAGKIDEAKKIVNDLPEKDYALYKKFKAKDKAIATDELKIKLAPVYDKVKELKEAGKIDEAKSIVDNMSDEEYRVYKLIKNADYKQID
jgi:soluble cytochrome b562